MSVLTYKKINKSVVALGMAACVQGCVSFDNNTKSTTPLAVTAEAVAPVSGTVEQSAFKLQMQKLGDTIIARAEAGIPVPVPVDAGGGPVHEQHKENYKTIYEAGMLYDYTGDTKYRDIARDVLLDYADLYPTLGLHPEHKPSTAGRLFWQGLNEAVWLVYSIQGYEVIRDDVSPEDREKIERGVLNPMADFLSEGSPQTFDRIHNHGTWAAAAVGMTGYVLDQPERVEKSLYGLNQDGEAGFLKQMDILFSPDGYYAEGPYYQRYAMMPFLLFSQAIQKNEPEREIFNYRDGIILKAISTTLQLSYAGKFFPLNDAIRSKGLNTIELKYGVAIAYDLTKDPAFLDIVKYQGDVVPTPEGKKVLDDIEAGLTKPFNFKSQMFRDGSNGEDGALIVLRSGEKTNDSAVVLKATTQGLGHGHFDKLGLLYNDNGQEVVADYGASRFLNIVSKFGGRYLPENDSWAKQTIAHNTLAVDEVSHYGGDWRLSQKYSPDVLKYGVVNGVQIAAAEVDTAYDGVNLQRVVAMVPRDDGQQPYVIDIMRGISDTDHQYDLPMHYKGDLIKSQFPIEYETSSLTPLGTDFGYQHLWKSGETEQLEGRQEVSLFLGTAFQTVTFASDTPYKAIFTKLGANDPDHNLRSEEAMILRANSDTVNFVTVYERDGSYDADNETAVFNGSTISSIDIDQVEDVAVYKLVTQNDKTIQFLVADDTSKDAAHQLELDDQIIEWSGPVHVLR